jgi:hypothetical protein
MTEAVLVRQRTRPAPRAVNVATPTQPEQAPALVAGEGTMICRSTVYGVEQEEREALRVPVFHASPARVRVSGGVTENMGNFSSIRVDVMVELPCLPHEVDIGHAYETAARIVEEKISERLDDGRARFSGENRIQARN